MLMRLNALTLQCREGREVIPFSPQISFYHGEISSGKSSIARLIDYCLGGRLEWTAALQRELVSAQLTARVGEYEVLFERPARSDQVQVTWRNKKDEGATVRAPRSAGEAPIWAEDVYNLSDLIFHLLGITPLKVRRSKREDDSPLVRLSFRDVMWYCYLSQTEMDSTFFRLEAPVVQTKSRDVMRFVVGYYTERLNDLEISLEETTEERYGKLNAAKQIRNFLRQHGLGTVEEITGSANETAGELQTALQAQEELRGSHRSDTHFADQLREQLRGLSADLEREAAVLADLDERLAQQDALKAELLSAKMKLARTTSASAVLAGVVFEACPSCGTGIANSIPTLEGACKLCGQVVSTSADEPGAQAEVITQDLTSRIEELQDSLLRHRAARRRQERVLASLGERKAALDAQLTQELAAYDSAFLARFRDVERRVATLQERLHSLQQMIRLPEAVGVLEREADQLAAEVERVKREIDAEKRSLTNAQRHIDSLEGAYLEALLAVNLPGVASWDQITLNPKTWVPSIAPGGNPELAWDYENAGSGGKKTLLKVWSFPKLWPGGFPKLWPLPWLLH